MFAFSALVKGWQSRHTHTQGNTRCHNLTVGLTSVAPQTALQHLRLHKYVKSLACSRPPPQSLGPMNHSATASLLLKRCPHLASLGKQSRTNNVNKSWWPGLVGTSSQGPATAFRLERPDQVPLAAGCGAIRVNPFWGQIFGISYQTFWIIWKPCNKRGEQIKTFCHLLCFWCIHTSSSSSSSSSPSCQGWIQSFRI